MNDKVSAAMAEAVDTPVVEEQKEGVEQNVEFVQTPELTGDESQPR